MKTAAIHVRQKGEGGYRAVVIVDRKQVDLIENKTLDIVLQEAVASLDEAANPSTDLKRRQD